MDRVERFSRLIWFAIFIGLTGLTLAALIAWLGGLAGGLIGLGVFIVSLFLWWRLIVFTRHADDATLHFKVKGLRHIHLQPITRVSSLTMDRPAGNLTVSKAAITADEPDRPPRFELTLFSAVSSLVQSPLTLGAAFASGAFIGLLLGILIARALGNIPAIWLLFAIIAFGALVGAGSMAVYQLRRQQVAQVTRTVSLAAFALSLGIFAFTRYTFIADYPIYFFTDEAINTVHAANLLKNGLRDASGELLPSYFPNGQYWNLSLTVYVQAVAVALFGKSIETTRLTFATFALLGALATGLLMKLVFKQRYYWIVVLFLAVTPAWFLHSRTAFETVLMVSCYSGFLLFYLLYRYRNPNYLFPALACGTATLYAYTNGQAVMLVSGLLLVLSDLRYHLKHWRTALLGAGFIVLLALPYFRFRIQHPEAVTSQLRILDSYLFLPISPLEKVIRFLREYSYGISPMYWFLPNTTDLDRHLMKGYGHILFWVLPFFVIGVLVCLRNLKSSMHRAVLIAALAAPFGSALAQIAVTRALMFVVPAAILSAIGFEWLVNWLKSPRSRALVAAGATAILVIAGFWMWRDALANGPTWFRNYSLYGMQWGARQLFEQAIPAYLQQYPDRRLLLSPSWSNGTDAFLSFFDVNQGRVQLLNIDHFLRRKQPLDENLTLVMLPDEVDRANASGKFKPFVFEQIIRAPDGTNAFYFTRAYYVDNVDDVFAQELEARRQLVTSTVNIGDATIDVLHSQLDMGEARNMFDNETFTLARGESANPFIIVLNFPTPRKIAGINAIFGRMDFTLKAQLFEEGSSQPKEYAATYQGLPGEPDVALDFPDAPANATRLRLEITQLAAPEDVHIHVRELTLR